MYHYSDIIALEEMIMSKNITLYHGSDNIIKKPIFGYGRKHNDYGLGFYCTENKELAKEWAVSSLCDGFSNCYTLDATSLNILNLNSPKYSVLNWIAILLEHRYFTIKTPIANKARRYLINNFSINVNAYDVVIGYRADDSYFDYAASFVNNMITINQLDLALKLGDLGEQIVLKSEYAFSMLQFQGYETVSKDKYFIMKKARSDCANDCFMEILNKDDDGLTIRDIMNEGIENNDTRIPRNISK